MEWGHWISMGGYAKYVWPSYGLLSLVLIGNYVLIRRHKKYVMKKLTQWLQERS